MSEHLVDRDRELTALDHALARARAGSGAALCLRGPAGIGKTAVLAAIAARAEGPVLRASGGRLEQAHPYGAVLELVEPVLAAANPDADLTSAAGPSLVALATGAGATPSLLPPADARMTLEHGLRRLLAELGRRSPGSVVIVDDVHWLDDASTAALAHATRAVHDSGVLLLLAARPEAEDDQRTRELLRRTAIIDLHDLGAPAIAQLAADALAQPDAEELAGPLLEQTGGNPLLVTRLLAELRREGRPVDRDTVLAARPRELADAVATRLDELGEHAARLATAVAVLGEDTALLRRAAALADLSVDDAAVEAERLVAADVLAAGDPLRFVHPLVAAATLDRLRAPARAAAHLRAARLLDADGARPGVVAARLLDAVPSGEPWAIAALRAAGEEALAQGDPAAASRVLRRALDEGPSADDRNAIAVPLARAAAFAGDADADDRTEAALAATPDPTMRVIALLDRGDALVAAGGAADARVVLERALAQAAAPGVPEQLRAYAIVAAETAAWVHGAPYDRPITPGAATLAGSGEEEAARALAGAASLALTGAGTAAEIDALALGALETLTGMARLGGGFLAAMALWTTDQTEPLARLFDEGAAWADAVGSPLATGTWEAGRGILAGWLGDLAAATYHCEQAVALEADGWDRHAPAVRAVLVHAAVDRGAIDEARRIASADAARMDAWAERIDHPMLLLARARTEARGDAAETLRAAGRAAERMSVRCPVLVPWREALAATVADPDEARTLAADHLALAEQLGTPRAVGTALRTTGVLERDPGRIEAAIDLLAPSPARLEHARAELALGEVLRRAGHRVDARTHLHEAITLAERCGASALVARARDELRAAGGRDRRGAADDELTPAERRVAELAATGASNPEIAERLFLGRRTVEMHLSRSYRKLGISGRGELAARLDVT